MNDLARSDDYRKWIVAIKSRVQSAQLKAAVSVNRELLQLYWFLGNQIVEKQELAKWGDAQPNGSKLHAQLYQAYFVDGEDISDSEVLLRLVEEAGLDVESARGVLTERSFSPAVDQDWQLAAQYGVTGVPTFVADGRGVVGAQPYEVLVQLVEAGGAVRREIG